MDGSGRLFDAVQVRDTPVLEFVRYGERVSTVNVRMRKEGDRIKVSFRAVPVTRVGGSLPDWPRALSLRPDVEKRQN